MSCCAPSAELDLHNAGPSADEIRLASRILSDGLRRSDLSVPDMHCGACLHKIETALGRLDGVSEARANLSARRVSVLWRGEAAPPMMAALDEIGYAAHLFDADDDRADPVLSNLLRALAVAGFAARTNLSEARSTHRGLGPTSPSPQRHRVCAADARLPYLRL